MHGLKAAGEAQRRISGHDHVRLRQFSRNGDDRGHAEG